MINFTKFDRFWCLLVYRFQFSIVLVIFAWINMLQHFVSKKWLLLTKFRYFCIKPSPAHPEVDSAILESERLPFIKPVFLNASDTLSTCGQMAFRQPFGLCLCGRLRNAQPLWSLPLWPTLWCFSHMPSRLEIDISHSFPKTLNPNYRLVSERNQ